MVIEEYSRTFKEDLEHHITYLNVICYDSLISLTCASILIALCVYFEMSALEAYSATRTIAQ